VRATDTTKASAILAEEAFDLAGDPKAFPEQLEQGLEVWQPRRLFFNGSTWWKKDLADIAKNDPDWFSVDVGGYDPLLGLSYTEIAGRSRSMHKSQGFGAAETRGEMLEYLKFVKGDRPKTEDIFEGIDMTWGRLKGGSAITDSILATINSFQPARPFESKQKLEKVHESMYNSVVHDSPFGYKLNDLNSLALACTGLVTEALAATPYASVSDSVATTLNVINRSPGKVAVYEVGFDCDGWKNEVPSFFTQQWSESLTCRLGSVTSPYWLDKTHGGLHVVDENARIGYPTWNAQRYARMSLSYEDMPLSSAPMVTYKWVDRVSGERIRPVYVTPVASVIPKTDVLIATGGTQTITVEVEALTDSLTGQLNMMLPEGWATTKDLKLVNIAKRNERQSFTFQLISSENAKGGPVKFEFSGPKGKSDRTLHEIDYPHIMPQVYYTPAEVKLVPLDVKTTAKRVGYVKGAGDDVPQALEQLGVTVEFVEPEAAKLEELLKYDAIVVGIRAYNSNKGMKELHPLLLQYVEQGGTLIVQYNTTPRFFSGASDFQIDPATLGPHPFTIGRGRVTVEEAPPTFLDPEHPLLNTPNTITAADFEGWVQERGLYFASDFGTHYTPLIAWNDPGEGPLNGALIVADHGKGRFIYTGISFFRQLPAGVPGAYRLFANLISPRGAK
jgi:hypothetical protein